MRGSSSRRVLGFLGALSLCISLWNCSDSRGRTLTILAPAAAGGGWDQTSRAMQQVLRDTGLVPSVQVLNVPGAGGVIGLAQLVSSHQGDADILMATGLIMVGAILTNESPLTLDHVTPIARLTGEYEILVVPAASSHQTLSDFIESWRRAPDGTAIAGGSGGGPRHQERAAGRSGFPDRSDAPIRGMEGGSREEQLDRHVPYQNGVRGFS